LVTAKAQARWITVDAETSVDQMYGSFVV